MTGNSNRLSHMFMCLSGIVMLLVLPAIGGAYARTEHDEAEARDVAQTFFSMIFNGVRLTARNPQRLVFNALLGNGYPQEYGCDDCYWVADSFAVRSVSKGKGEAFTAVVEYGKCIRVLKTFKVRERRTGLRDSIEILDGKVIRAPREDVIGAQAFIRNFSRQGYSVYHVMRARTIVEKEFPPVRARR